jgi:hypothetical protein
MAETSTDTELESAPANVDQLACANCGKSPGFYIGCKSGMQCGVICNTCVIDNICPKCKNRIDRKYSPYNNPDNSGITRKKVRK